MSTDEIKNAVCRAVKKMPRGDAIERIRLFGSYLHGDATAASDVDLLLDIDHTIPFGFFDLFDTEEALRQALGREVDVVTPQGLREYVRETILAEAVTLYEREKR